ncbi:MAG: hypothetical protein HY302_02830 [Opitutae bacterium]|nr:hypothetical protein [Opitutae bacterium]
MNYAASWSPRIACTGWFALLAARAWALDPTWEYAVQASATVRANPAQIVLTWPLDATPATSFTVHRKAVPDAAWGPGTALPGNATSFTDDNVVEGTLYEYQIVKRADVTGYGYLVAGVNAPLVDRRGRVLLVVDSALTAVLAEEIQTLRRDLIGDGWSVTQLSAARTATPTQVRDAIRAQYRADPANTRAVFLLGRIPIARSGNLSVDGHGGRPLACDGFYGDMDGVWADANNDGLFDPSTFPSNLELEVGRVDFSNMPGTDTNTRFAAEEVLLQQYLFKDHDYRHAVVRPARRGLIADTFGRQANLANSASAFRAFSTFFGHQNTELVNTDAPAENNWMTRLAARDYLWVFGAGGGSPTTMAGLGTHGTGFEVWSSDFVNLRAKGTFYLLFGSWFVEWDRTDNLMRAALAAPDYGLTAAWSGRPHLYFHRMAMGETVGAGIRLSQNNDTLYTNHANRQTRGVHIALMGDPTLRMGVIAPPSALAVTMVPAGAQLQWAASPDPVRGYHVYRANTAEGDYTRVTGALVTATEFTDPAGTAEHHYMVRAVALETSASGTYFTASQGAFRGQSAAAPAAPPATPTGPVVAPAAAPAGKGGGGAPSWPFTLLIVAALLGRQRLRRGNRAIEARARR